MFFRSSNGMKKPSIFDSLDCFSRKRRTSEAPNVAPRPLDSLDSIKTNNTDRSQRELLQSETEYIDGTETKRKAPLNRTVSSSTYIDGPEFVEVSPGNFSSHPCSSNKSSSKSRQSTGEYFLGPTPKPKRASIVKQPSMNPITDNDENVFDKDEDTSLYWS